jgi:hypothetical protein
MNYCDAGENAVEGRSKAFRLTHNTGIQHGPQILRAWKLVHDIFNIGPSDELNILQ